MYGERGADFGLGIWKHIDPESEFKFHQLIYRQQEYLRFGPGQWQCRLGLEAGWILEYSINAADSHRCNTECGSWEQSDVRLPVFGRKWGGFHPSSGADF